MGLMLKIMQNMQSMQEQLMKQGSSSQKGSKEDGAEEPETIRGGIELQRLPEWSLEGAPVDFQAWLLLIGPQMSDLSSSSGEWWAEIVETARKWYAKHQTMRPIEKLQHEIAPTAELQRKKWTRLEKRASSLLLQALPGSQKEDVISTKSMSVLGILGRRGLHEKAAVLTALESPSAASSVGEAITGLRRWIRWKRRAADINVALPDPTILNKVLMGVPSSQFRVNLTRTTLMLDAVPNMQGIEQYAECLLAEFDQMSYARRERSQAATQPHANPKVKKMDDVKVAEDPKKEKLKCRFYLTEEGCRRGKSCKWSHDIKDDAKR